MALDHCQLHEARAQTLALVRSVSDGDLEAVHSPLLSPLVWDLGHIAAFEDLWLAHRRGGLALLHPELSTVYDAFETPRASRGTLPYLRRADAEEYLRAVRDRVEALRLPADDPLAELVARHERQHAETMLQTIALADMSDWQPPAASSPDAGEQRPRSGLELVPVPGASFPLGAGETGFAYDNERPLHLVDVETFAIGAVAVTNRDWLAFIDAGGYEQPAWWSVDGWKWRREEHAERPLRWLDGGRERTLRGIDELLLDAPVVHISYYEAEAFARAHELRLPTEAEWELAATWDADADEKRSWPWGERAPTHEDANLIESALLRPMPAATHAAGASPCGALGMVGDVWEWTASRFGGYPGFRADPYPEYSEVFFGPDYRVLRGGSFATSRSVATPTFRNWDFPGRRQIFAGVRMAAG